MIEPQYNEQGGDAIYRIHTASLRTETMPIKQSLRFHMENAARGSSGDRREARSRGVLPVDSEDANPNIA